MIMRLAGAAIHAGNRKAESAEWRKTPGTAAILSASRWLIPRTACGETAPSSFRARRHRRVPDAKWDRERDYRLVKDVWAFHDNRIAVRFQYEWQDVGGAWHRSYGNEQQWSSPTRA